MHLKEVNILGFKSFPEKTSLSFGTGVTVVVGPNGCGKSNIFDGIKWALGEQSPKSLRGSKMEDVIFSGTQNYPPLNYAEVILTFCNEDRYLPIDYKEVSICRRLYRSGESQYFLNKNIVRLKDIQELFMGTGVGESTYSFVEQGKIEIFLSYKPEDKRLIFDEASGIVKYKERKKEALRRLQDTDENLLRLEDILSELRRQIRYLERQAAKAKRYKKVQKELIEVEKDIAALQFVELRDKNKKILEELNIFKEKEAQKNSRLKEVNSQWEESNSQLKLLRASLERAATAIVSLRAQIESSDSHIAIGRQRINEIQQRNSNLELTKKNLEERLKLQQLRNKEETERLAAIANSVKNIEEVLKKIELDKESLKARIEKAKKGTTREKTTILDLEGRKVQFRNTFIELQTKLSSLSNRKKRLLLDKSKLQALLQENKESIQRAEQEFAKAENSLEALEDRRDNLVNNEKELSSSIESLKAKLIDKEKELLELNATYEFLKDLRIKYETFSVKKKITVIFDEEPKGINKLVASLQDVEFKKEGDSYRAQIEVKVVSFEEKQLEEKMASVQIEIRNLKSGQQDLEGRKNKLVENISVENEQLQKARSQLQEKTQQKNNLRREAQRFEEEFELLADEEKITLEDMDDCQFKQGQIKGELSVCEDKLDKANESLLEVQEIISNGSENTKEMDIEIMRNLSQIQSSHKEKESLSSKITFFKDEINNIVNNLEQIEKEEEESISRIKSFNEQLKRLEDKIKDDKIKIEECTLRKKGLEEEEATLNTRSDELRELIASFEKEIQEVKDSAHNKELQIQSVEYEKQKIKDYLRQVYNIGSDVSFADSSSKDRQILLQEKISLQGKVKSLGEVNLVAIEEFEELRKRENFLDTQKQDLITSKENLKKAISKINRTSKDIFLETFTKIEGEFKKNFRFLFNGGKANLVLVDPDNVLESGVEIEVQPPGKKLQNVSLLSGGEKALTAIALIFAIFTVKPSPLCVLDEIDAPLDEANVDRFNHLLRQFSASTQFIIITHNKKTMSNASCLYGITMQEKGISKLVSVKFAEEEVAAAR
ncbi:MAG: AAA family ATPase [Omnitrophica bacterium]|nr:AAA family ATPase [Candidatus Omnitrophota bacterium]